MEAASSTSSAYILPAEILENEISEYWIPEMVKGTIEGLDSVDAHGKKSRIFLISVAC